MSTTEDNDNKRQKRSPADELICPITRELLWEPVTAEDGHVYEKASITEHIRQCKHKPQRKIISPLKNIEMGPNLFPAHHIRNLIEILIADGSIQGELAEVWNKKVEEAKEKEKVLLEEAKEKEKVLHKANNGDLDAMLIVSSNYAAGSQGFPQDYEQSYHWAKKGHLAGSIKCTAKLGRKLVNAQGCNKSESAGCVLLGIAAAKGSNLAAHTLGMAYANGKYGLYNRDEAIRWLNEAIKDECQYAHLNEKAKETAKAQLDDLMRGHATP